MINITSDNIETNSTIADNDGTVDIGSEIGGIPTLPTDSVIELDQSPHNMKELLPTYLTEGNYNVINTGNTHIFYTGTKSKIDGTNIIS